MTIRFRSAFTEQLREIDGRARRIAVRYRHEKVDLAHYLLAFIEDPAGSLRDIASENDPGLSATQRKIEGFLGQLPKSTTRRSRAAGLGYARRLESIFEQARRTAIQSGVTRISPERLFLALASEDFYSEAERTFAGNRLLSPVGMTPHQIEQQLSSHRLSEDH